MQEQPPSMQPSTWGWSSSNHHQFITCGQPLRLQRQCRGHFVWRCDLSKIGGHGRPHCQRNFFTYACRLRHHMGSGGITEEGITNSHNLLIDIQKEMLRAAQKVIFCLDHTKFGRRSVSFLCDLGQVDSIITDTKAPPALLEHFSSKGIEIVLAH